MKQNLFLSKIAKGFNSKIEFVAFCNLDGPTGQSLGLRDKQLFIILIDEKKLKCPHRIFATFFHEVGHIVLHHLTWRGPKMEYLALEEEADKWTFYAMGMIDRCGEVKKECALCYQCMTAKSKTCLKGFRENDR